MLIIAFHKTKDIIWKAKKPSETRTKKRTNMLTEQTILLVNVS